MSKSETKHNRSLDLFDALKREDILWSKKAHGLWQSQGDKSSKFFHKVVESQAKTNNLSELVIDGKKKMISL